jgi:hypothetical protein
LFIKEKVEVITDDTILISRDALFALMINNDAYTPRTVVLQRGRKGFGFVLRGSRGNYYLSQMNTLSLSHNSRREIISTKSIISCSSIS